MVVGKEFLSSPDRTRAFVFLAAVVFLFLTSYHNLGEDQVFHLNTDSSIATLPIGGSICLEDGMSEQWKGIMEDTVHLINQHKPTNIPDNRDYTLYKPGHLPIYLHDSLCDLTVRSLPEIPMKSIEIAGMPVNHAQLGFYIHGSGSVELYGNEKSDELPKDYFTENSDVSGAVLLAMHETGHARGLRHSFHPLMDTGTVMFERFETNPQSYSSHSSLMQRSIREVFWGSD